MSVPYGVPGDKLAQLAGDPVCEAIGIDPNEIWGFINRAMD
jgi:hypothetical protein